MNDYLALLLTLLIRHVRHFNQILLICPCAGVVGYPMTFERENTHTIYCF